MKPADYKQKYLKVPIYPARVLLVVTDDDSYMKSKFYFDGTEVFDGFVHDITWKNIEVYLLWVRPSVKPGIIAHEAFHLASRIFEKIGDNQPAYVRNEPFAYLLGYLVDELTALLNK